MILFRAKKSTKVFYFSHYKAQLFLYDDLLWFMCENNDGKDILLKVIL